MWIKRVQVGEAINLGFDRMRISLGMFGIIVTRVFTSWVSGHRHAQCICWRVPVALRLQARSRGHMSTGLDIVLLQNPVQIISKKEKEDHSALQN